MSDNTMSVGFINPDDFGIPVDPDVALPTVQDREYWVDDDDAMSGHWIYESELTDSYVDNNIDSIRIMLPDLWDHPDNYPLYVTYTNGLSYEVVLGQIDWGGGSRAERYRKSGGIIFPTDPDGTAILLDNTNTPNLVAIRAYIHEEWAKVQHPRLEIAELVCSFSQIISGVSGLDGIR